MKSNLTSIKKKNGKREKRERKKEEKRSQKKANPPFAQNGAKKKGIIRDPGGALIPWVTGEKGAHGKACAVLCDSTNLSTARRNIDCPGISTFEEQVDQKGLHMEE
jgi:hypothetical protein